MPIYASVGSYLVRDDGEQLTARRGAKGIGWHCAECKYQSYGVWEDASDASRSLAYHMEHVCTKRLRRAQ